MGVTDGKGVQGNLIFQGEIARNCLKWNKHVFLPWKEWVMPVPDKGGSLFSQRFSLQFPETTTIQQSFNIIGTTEVDKGFEVLTNYMILVNYNNITSMMTLFGLFLYYRRRNYLSMFFFISQKFKVPLFKYFSDPAFFVLSEKSAKFQ